MKSVETPVPTFAGRAVTACGWLTIAIGIAHRLVGATSASHLSEGLLWFEGSGIAVILMGGLTVLTRRRTSDAAVYYLTVSANVVGAVLGLVFSIITDWGEPHGPVLIVLFATAVAACVALRRIAPIG